MALTSRGLRAEADEIEWEWVRMPVSSRKPRGHLVGACTCGECRRIERDLRRLINDMRDAKIGWSSYGAAK